MGTVQHIHNQYRIYTDPKSGVEIHIFKNLKSEGYDSNYWGYGTNASDTDDQFSSLKIAWQEMQKAVRQIHSDISGMNPDELEAYARGQYRTSIARHIARAMARKKKSVITQKKAKSIVIRHG